MDDKNILELKNNIKTLRKKHHMTQQELAEMIGTTRKTIYSVESSEYVPSVKLAILIATALDEEFYDVFYLE